MSNDEQAGGFVEEVRGEEFADENAIASQQVVRKSQAGMQADIGSVGKEKSGGDVGGVVEREGGNAHDSIEHRELSSAEVTDIFAVLDRNGDGQVQL